MTQLRDRVVWITGASSGIGEALAVAAARRGAKLILSARRQAELERVRQRCPDPARAAVLPLDLLALDDPQAVARAAAQPFGPVDILVNNAGISQRSFVLDTGMDVYRRILELDFFAPVALTKALLPDMVARGSGHIVVISSVVGHFGTPRRSGYAAAKHAVHGFFEAARAEVWKQGVRVTVACPGYVRTQVSVNAVTGDGSAHGIMDGEQAEGMDPEVCAEKIWRAVEKDRDEVLIGREAIAVYLKRFFPAVLRRILRRVTPT